MKKSLCQIFTIALLFALATSCCPCRRASGVSHAALKTTVWNLVQIEGRNVAGELVEEASPRIVFDQEGTFGGYAGCNSMGGSYKMTPSEALSQRDVAGEISLSGLYSTKRYCPNDRLEMQFMKLLSEVDSFTIEQNRLFLFSGGEMKLLFEASEGVVEK